MKRDWTNGTRDKVFLICFIGFHKGGGHDWLTGSPDRCHRCGLDWLDWLRPKGRNIQTGELIP